MSRSMTFVALLATTLALLPGPADAGSAVDLEVVATRLAPQGPLASDTTGPVEYLVEVINHGPAVANEVVLRVDVREGLTTPDWTCAVPDASCEPALGEGAVLTRFDLPVGARASVNLIGNIAAGARFVILDASAPAVAGQVRLNPDDDQLRLLDPIGTDGLFKDGFEAVAAAGSAR
jgi:hypothetical protein